MAVFYFNNFAGPVTNDTTDDAPHAATDPELVAALTTITDQLLNRVSVLTATLNDGDPAAGIDSASTRTLLDDLLLVVGAWQSLGTSAARRLHAAETALAEAARAIDRAMKEDGA